MTHKRSVKKGSFGAHFDELVKHFPQDAPQPQPVPQRAARNLEEDRDIHALLFERAWQVEYGRREDGSA